MDSKNNSHKQTIFIALFFFIILLAWTIWQFHFNYMVSLYDTFFHSERIYEIRLAFQQHQLPSWVNFNSFFNTGQAINGMYPDITLWPFVFLTNFLTPIHQIIAIKALIAGLGFIVTFLSINKRFDSRNAILAATIFTLSGSVLKDLVNEMQTGTALVMIFAFPIFFTLKEAIESEKIDPPLIIKTALLMFWVIGSHLLSAVVITIVVGIFLIINTIIKKNYLAWLNLIIAAGLTVILCAPILYRLMKISQTGLLSPFGLGHVDSLSLWQIFWTSRWNTKSTISWLSIILLLIVIFKFNRQKLRQLLPWLSVEVVLILLSSNIVPWNLLGKLPIINNFQNAAWRFAPFLGIIPIILILINFSSKTARKIFFGVTILSYLMAGYTGFQAQYHKTAKLPIITQNSTTPTGLNGYAKVTSSGITSDTLSRTLIPDYAPNSVPLAKGTDGLSLDPRIVYLINGHLGVTKGREIPLKHNSTNVNSITLTADNVPKGEITLPVYGYNSLIYQIKLNGQRVKASRSSEGFITIHSNKNFQHATYQITQIQPKMYRPLLWMSTVLLIVLIGLLTIPKIKKARQL